MKRALLALGIAVGILAAGAGAGYWWLTRSVELQAFDDGSAPYEVRERNGFAIAMLGAVGITSALVDITPERALIAYDVPADPPVGTDLMQTHALLVAAAIAPETTLGVIAQYVDQAPVLMWEADLGALRTLEDADELAAYVGAVKKTTF